MPSKLQLMQVVKRFGDGAAAAVNGISLGVDEGEMLVLLGPSGCGKTTTLQIIAGLIHPDGGSVVIDGQTVAGPGWGLAPERRNLGMVFQSYAIWPHKTVSENVAYGLQLRRLSPADIRRKVRKVLDMVQLRGLEERYPSEISGGQQQRVALARSIVVNPSLLLLDEPLSNLDAALREQMRGELKELQRELGLASIYVTHDQLEAMTLADRLIVMNDGGIAQEGAPEHVFSRPKSRFVAGFLGTTNLLKGQVVNVHGDIVQLDVPDIGSLQGYAADEVKANLRPGGNAWLSVRPIAVTIGATRPPNATNALEARVGERTFLGDFTEYTVHTRAFRWRVHAISSERVSVREKRVGFHLHRMRGRSCPISDASFDPSQARFEHCAGEGAGNRRLRELYIRSPKVRRNQAEALHTGRFGRARSAGVYEAGNAP